MAPVASKGSTLPFWKTYVSSIWWDQKTIQLLVVELRPNYSELLIFHILYRFESLTNRFIDDQLSGFVRDKQVLVLLISAITKD